MKMDLSPTQKANIRKRLKAADDVVMKIQQSGVECNALVRNQPEVDPFKKGWGFFFQEHAREQEQAQRVESNSGVNSVYQDRKRKQENGKRRN